MPLRQWLNQQGQGSRQRCCHIGALLKAASRQQRLQQVRKVGHIGATEHGTTQGHGLQGVLATKGPVLRIKTTPHHHHGRCADPGAHLANYISHKNIGVRSQAPASQVTPERRRQSQLPRLCKHFLCPLGMARCQQQSNWMLRQLVFHPGFKPLPFFTGMAAGQQQHRPAGKHLLHQLKMNAIDRRRIGIELGGAQGAHIAGPKTPKTLGIGLGLGQAYLHPRQQPAGINREPPMPQIGALAHAGIDQMQMGHRLHQLRPELRLRQYPQTGPPIAAKGQQGQPMIYRHVLVNRSRRQYPASQSGGGACHRCHQQHWRSSTLTQLPQHGQQAVEFAHTGGVKPQQRTSWAAAAGPAQPLPQPAGILLALGQADQQQDQPERGQDKGEQSIDPQQQPGLSSLHGHSPARTAP